MSATFVQQFVDGHVLDARTQDVCADRVVGGRSLGDHPPVRPLDPKKNAARLWLRSSLLPCAKSCEYSGIHSEPD